MQKGTWITVGILVVVVLLVGGYFLMKGNSGTSNETSSPAIQNTTGNTTTTEDGETMEITVEGKEFSYSPSTFKVKAGQKVKVLFKNVGEMDHDFVVEELGVRTKIVEEGEEDTLEFVAPTTPGKLTFYCSVGSHRAMGMEGTITVE